VNQEPDLLAKGAKLLGTTSHPHYERAWWELHRNMMLSQGLSTSFPARQLMTSQHVNYGSLDVCMTRMTNNERRAIVSFGLDRLVERLGLTSMKFPAQYEQYRLTNKESLTPQIYPQLDWPNLVFDCVLLNEAHVLYLLVKRLKLDASKIARLVVMALEKAHIDCAYELLRYIFACPFPIDSFSYYVSNQWVTCTRIASPSRRRFLLPLTIVYLIESHSKQWLHA
jgi:hypothetical protein